MVHRPAPSARNRVGVHGTAKQRRKAGSKQPPRCSLVVFIVFLAGFVICFASTLYVYYEINKLSGKGTEADNVIAFTRNLISRRDTNAKPKAAAGRSLRGGVGIQTAGIVAAATAIATTDATAARVREKYTSFSPSPSDDGGFYASCYSHGTTIGAQHSHVVNDDYCDCSTGADEFQTAACSRILVATPVFDCGNGQPHIFASRVDDGVCDCANGRDEASTVACGHKSSSSSTDGLSKIKRYLRTRQGQYLGR